jgi:hypothetical protein
MEALMRKLLVLAAATAMLALGLGVWFKTADTATGSVSPASISPYDLHLRTDAKKLPDTTIEGIN